jgi:hypothetical protein
MNQSNETPKDAALRFVASHVRNGFELEALHTYCDVDGSPLHWRIRLKNQSTKEKVIRPMMRANTGFKLGEPKYPNGKPLYRLQDFTTRRDQVLIVTEGELKADRLTSKFHCSAL